MPGQRKLGKNNILINNGRLSFERCVKKLQTVAKGLLIAKTECCEVLAPTKLCIVELRMVSVLPPAERLMVRLSVVRYLVNKALPSTFDTSRRSFKLVNPESV